MPPIRTNASSSTQTPSSEGHIKRPPNAWILFRNDMLKSFPPPPPGQPRLPQAVISGIISGMWRDASPETRLEYLTQSRLAHLEHRKKYPGYRFRPMKSEEKTRIREEREAQKAQRKQEREKASQARRNGRGNPTPPSLMTTPLLAGPAIPGTTHASSGGTTVAPPLVGHPTDSCASGPIQRAGRAPTTPSTQYLPPSSSPSATMLPTLRLSPYPPPPNAFSAQTAPPQPGMPQYLPPLVASQWQQPSPPHAQSQQLSPPYVPQPSPPYAQSQQPSPPYAQSQQLSPPYVPQPSPPQPSASPYVQPQPQEEEECAVSPTTLQEKASLAYEQQLTIRLPAQPALGLTERDLSSLQSLSYEPANEDAALGFITEDDEHNFDGLPDSSGSFDGSMGNTVGQGDLSDFAELFDTFIQDVSEFSNVTGPSQPIPPPPMSTMPPTEFNMSASLRESLEEANLLDAGDFAGPPFLAPEAQPEIPSPPIYVPPAGATYSATRRVGADWRHRRVSSDDIAMS